MVDVELQDDYGSFSAPDEIDEYAAEFRAGYENVRDLLDNHRGMLDSIDIDSEGDYASVLQSLDRQGGDEAVDAYLRQLRDAEFELYDLDRRLTVAQDQHEHLYEDAVESFDEETAQLKDLIGTTRELRGEIHNVAQEYRHHRKQLRQHQDDVLETPAAQDGREPTAGPTMEREGMDPDIGRLFAAVDRHLARKDGGALYRAHVWLKNRSGDGKPIAVDDGGELPVSLDAFDTLFSAFRENYDTEMEYGGSVSEDIQDRMIDDLLDENEVRPEQLVSESLARRPVIRAYDTEDGIRYEGRMHVVTDVAKPYGEKPLSWVGDEDEEELVVSVTVPAEKATDLPAVEENKATQETEESVFETEVEYA